MKTYQFQTNSNAAPFCSDSNSGFIEAESPMQALKEVVSKYTHPAGLYSASINEATVENKMVARYLSSRAATSYCAGVGSHETKGGKLYVNGELAIEQMEKWETFQ